MTGQADRSAGPPRAPPAARAIDDPRLRGLVIQILLFIAVAALLGWIANNAYQNLQRANIASGFGFLDNRAGFNVSQALIPFSSNASYTRAFFVGLLNTLLVAGLGIVFATIVGFAVGIARLSQSWLLSSLAGVYVETLRNIPLLLQLLFWYRAVLAVLPAPRQAYQLPLGSNLNNRGLFLPQPLFGPEFAFTLLAGVVAVMAAIGVVIWARRRQRLTGRRFPAARAALALVVLVPLAVFALSGAPVTVELPQLAGFNYSGGLQIRPEFLALLLGLSLYTASFIADNVRGGIMAVSHGQREAALALGLSSRQTLRLVVVPQALRVIIPPLTSQYLNLTKNSSLAVAVGYPDLVAVFGGTVLNQTGQAIEVIFITMSVYLTISLITSLFMNWYNARRALVER